MRILKRSKGLFEMIFVIKINGIQFETPKKLSTIQDVFDAIPRDLGGGAIVDVRFTKSKSGDMHLEKTSVID